MAVLDLSKVAVVGDISTQLNKCNKNKKTCCKALIPKKCTNTLRISQSHSRCIKNFLFSPFSSVHMMPFPKSTICYQNLPF